MKFVDVSIEDYGQIHGFCSRFGENSCQHSFVNMFTLKEKYGSKFCIQDGFLHVLRENLGDGNFRTYLFPMGEGDTVQAVRNLLDDASSHGKKLKFQTITESKKDWLEENFPGQFDFSEDRDYAEYIYHSQKLIEMRGGAFKNKRSEIRSFFHENENRVEIARITEKDRDDILEFEKNWMQNTSNVEDKHGLEIEMREIGLQMENFERLHLSGILIRLDGKIAAFGYGVPLNCNCFDYLIAKADRNVLGIYKILHNEVIKNCGRNFLYANFEEDVGVEGLRNLKLGYQPDILLRKYIVVQK